MTSLKVDIINAASIGSAYSSYTVVGPSSIDVNIYDQLTLFVAVHQAPSGTNPTLDVMMQHSPNGTNMWVPLATIARIEVPAISADDAQVEWPIAFAVSVPGIGTAGAKSFGTYVRVLMRTSGTVPIYTVSSYLMAKG